MSGSDFGGGTSFLTPCAVEVQVTPVDTECYATARRRCREEEIWLIIFRIDNAGASHFYETSVLEISSVGPFISLTVLTPVSNNIRSTNMGNTSTPFF